MCDPGYVQGHFLLRRRVLWPEPSLLESRCGRWLWLHLHAVLISINAIDYLTFPLEEMEHPRDIIDFFLIKRKKSFKLIPACDASNSHINNTNVFFLKKNKTNECSPIEWKGCFLSITEIWYYWWQLPSLQYLFCRRHLYLLFHLTLNNVAKWCYQLYVTKKKTNREVYYFAYRHLASKILGQDLRLRVICFQSSDSHPKIFS